MTILAKLAKAARTRVAKRKEILPLARLIEIVEAKSRPKARDFRAALSGEGLSFICEVKKASPSQGIIAPDFLYEEIAEAYAKNGAAAVSVLTEPDYFLGSDEILKTVKERVELPILRKDFTVDPYQIYEAAYIGADAVLLICALLTKEELANYGAIARGLGLSVLVEAHTEAEIKLALAAGADIIGVNNRNLKTFAVDFGNTARLRHLVPREIPFVAESGIKTRADILALGDIGVDAVLIGEALMRSGNIARGMGELMGYD